MSLLADYNLPFAVALVLMALLGLVQVIGLAGHWGHLHADIDAHGDVDGFADGLLSFLGIGRVPFMVWLVLFLLVFALLGVGIQALAGDLLGAPLDRWVAAAIAGGAGLPVTGLFVRPIAAILPSDESTAVGLDSLVGRRAKIVTGRATIGNPARAEVRELVILQREPFAGWRERELLPMRNHELLCLHAADERDDRRRRETERAGKRRQGRVAAAILLVPQVLERVFEALPVAQRAAAAPDGERGQREREGEEREGQHGERRRQFGRFD